MASSKFVLAITVNTDGSSVAGAISPTGVPGNPFTGGADAWDWIHNLGKYLQEEALGRGIKVSYYDTAVAASTTGTFTGNPTAADTITVNGVVFTARDNGAVANEFNIGTTKELTATNLAAAINASVTAGVVGVVTASASGAIVTFSSLVPGSVGKNTPITESLGNFTLAAVTFATGGTQAHSATVSAGA